MGRNYRKKIVSGILAMTLLGTLTGCQKLQLDYTEEDYDLYAQYAANLLLKYDKNYIDRMPEVEVETKKTQTQAPTAVSGAEENQTVVTDVNQAFEYTGLSIRQNGFEVLDSYPSTSDSLAMSMIAIKGQKLLVMKFQVTNTTQTDQTVDFAKSGAVYRGVINGTIRMNVQHTALLDALNTYQGTIPAGQTIDLVLVFQVDESDATNISTLALNLTLGDKQVTVEIN